MTIGLLLASLTLGLRHGIDWDHIAAIADLSSTAETRRRGFGLSMLYAIGHGAVVFALGAAAIFAGAAIPHSVDAWMGRIVGMTLVALGIWILVELARKRRAFRLQSRWILIITGTFAGLRRVRNSRSHRHVTVDHDHVHDHVTHEGESHASAVAHDHAHVLESADITELAPLATGQNPTGPMASTETCSAPHDKHTHRHSHRLALPADPSARYGNGTATGIGMLHGVGIESPTQIALFVASTSVAGASVGLLLLAGWIAGLIIANSGLALLAGFGLLHAERNFGIYATLAVIVGVMSIAMGTMFALGL
jgi:ABC-type nickel/cobalt efflux system permease component RcnA